MHRLAATNWTMHTRFSLKFRDIVEKEEGQNFITRLHRGCIQVIPWPVIHSPNFYSLFLRLCRQLDKQKFTYTSGGTFLHNLKTLMAKLKVSVVHCMVLHAAITTFFRPAIGAH
jgi:hypothetical protein